LRHEEVFISGCAANGGGAPLTLAIAGQVRAKGCDPLAVDPAFHPAQMPVMRFPGCRSGLNGKELTHAPGQFI
jgi:hypothetical protein